jgi:hypothetical protein
MTLERELDATQTISTKNLTYSELIADLYLPEKAELRSAAEVGVKV